MAVYLTATKHALNQSFFIAPPVLTEKNLPDQSGKVFLITGANTGIGYQVTSFLYGANAKVWLACRTKSKAEDAMASIKAKHPKSTGSLHFLKLDLSDLSTIKASAEEFLSKETKLHWLDNNAGVMLPPDGSKGAQGHELQLTTNVLGPFLLTKLLLPLLKKTAQSEGSNGSVRVSWAGSIGVDLFSPRSGIAFKKDPQTQDLMVRNYGSYVAGYGASKAANYFLAKEFGRRGLDGKGDGVLHNSYNPGNLVSDISQHMAKWPLVGGIAVWLFNLPLYPTYMGAYTQIYAGLSKDLTLEADQGGYIIPWGRKTMWNRPDVTGHVGEGRNSDKLYQWCEAQTKEFA